MTRSLTALAAALSVLSVLGAVPVVAASSAPLPPARQPVIAFVGESGMNVLHRDFAAVDASDAAHAVGVRVRAVTLPQRGSFEARRQAVRQGPLGHLEPGVVYAVRGTRLLVVSAPGASPKTDVTASGEQFIGTAPTDPTMHGTGVVDAAIGRRFGTAPTAIGVLVLGSVGDAWNWVAQQRWIDLVSMSDYEPASLCRAASAVRAFTARGGLAFSSSGNTTDALEPLSSPNGLPEVYEVGGVDADGKPYVPPHVDSDPWFAAGNVVRPYETGELFSFTTAGYDGFTTTMRFGGTSGATPRTAGWAADLLMQALRLRSAVHGPLSDGRLTGLELRRLLHHVARPTQPSGAAGFAVEGFGRLDRAAIDVASQVLAGRMAEPVRAEDDGYEADVESVRAMAFASC